MQGPQENAKKAPAEAEGEEFHLEPSSATEDQREEELRRLSNKLRDGTLTPLDQRHMAELVETETAKATLIASRSESFSGPLPHPDLLCRYDDDTLREIVRMAAKEQDHHHLMQKTGLEGTINRDRRGQNFGLMIALAGLGVTAWLAQYSATWAGIIGAVDLVGLVAIFVAPRVLQFKKQQPPDKDDS